MAVLRAPSALALLPIAGVIVVGVVLGGCGSGFKYYAHGTAGGSDTYFKVPSSWNVIGSTQLIEEINPHLSSVQVRQVESKLWIMAFDVGSTKVSGLGSFSLLAPRVFGEIVARPLGAAERKNYSTATLRSELLNVDPVKAATSGNPFFRVLSYRTVVRPNGLKGNSFIVDIQGPSGQRYTVAQEGLLDARNGWVYVIGVGCRASCFSAHQSAIDTVLNSWNVKENL